MFTSKKDFIQAMLDGRKFKEGNMLYEFNEDSPHVLRQVIRFDMFNSVTEIQMKPEKFKPEPGDIILVWGQNENMAGERKFIGMLDGWYICEYKDSSAYPEGFPNAKAIPNKTEWIKHDGKSWPSCKPDDEIEGKDRLGHIIIDHADWFVWSWSNKGFDEDIIEWRLANV